MNNTEQNKDGIRICALMLEPYDVCPGQRFRIEQWEPYVRENNITIDYFSLTDEKYKEIMYKKGNITSKAVNIIKANIRRLKHIIKASKYDIIYLYRYANIIGPAFLEKFMQLRGYPIILDFDDAIFITNTSKANTNFGWLKFSHKISTICRLSTSVSVGNTYLAEYARKYNENVFVIPTSIDTDHYKPTSKKSNENRKVVVGWTGSSTSQYHLEEFEPTLIKLLEKRDDVEIRVISNREPAFKKIPYTWRPWSATTEIEEIGQIDIGIMPTPDDDWSRGKCALKALQYMALGIPAICTDMGANRDVITQGENGYLAKDTEQWLKYFDILIDDADFRHKLGDKARETVVNEYSMKKCAELFGMSVRKTLEISNSRRK